MSEGPSPEPSDDEKFEPAPQTSEGRGMVNIEGPTHPLQYDPVMPPLEGQASQPATVSDYRAEIKQRADKAQELIDTLPDEARKPWWMPPVQKTELYRSRDPWPKQVSQARSDGSTADSSYVPTTGTERQASTPSRGQWEMGTRAPLSVDPNVVVGGETWLGATELQQMHEQFRQQEEARDELIHRILEADFDLVLTPEQRRMVLQEMLDHRLRAMERTLGRLSPAARTEVVEVKIGELLEDVRPMVNDYTLVRTMEDETAQWANSLGGRIADMRGETDE